jgi:hypothetical protein
MWEVLLVLDLVVLFVLRQVVCCMHVMVLLEG